MLKPSLGRKQQREDFGALCCIYGSELESYPSCLRVHCVNGLGLVHHVSGRSGWLCWDREQVAGRRRNFKQKFK